MKFVTEYRNADKVKQVIAKISQIITKHWVIMEVCGGQTHSIMRFGLDQILPEKVELVHGPGCPVCVTPVSIIDKATTLAGKPNVIFTSFGDMLRVPGSFTKDAYGDLTATDLFSVKSQGGDVRIVYSPLEAVEIAQQNPDKTVVFFAIGFETTAPANAMAIILAEKLKLTNFCLLASHVTVPPAIAAVMSSPEVRVNGFLAAGHVCTIMGTSEYEPLANQFKIPIVVTGFEPLDLAMGIYKVVSQLGNHQHFVEIAYDRAVAAVGNKPAQAVLSDVFETVDRSWRGIGQIPKSGLGIRDKYALFDAEKRYPEIMKLEAKESPLCQSGQVLQGLIKPNQCPAFGNLCTPSTPLGATMVSGEGACAAYYNYKT